MSDIEVLRKLTKVFNEIKKDDEEGHSSAYELQLEDIETIENLIIENNHLKEHLQKYYNGELYTAKQLKNIEENQRKYFIHKSKVKEKIDFLKEVLAFAETGRDEKAKIQANLLKNIIIEMEKLLED